MKENTIKDNGFEVEKEESLANLFDKVESVTGETDNSSFDDIEEEDNKELEEASTFIDTEEALLSEQPPTTTDEDIPSPIVEESPSTPTEEKTNARTTGRTRRVFDATDYEHVDTQDVISTWGPVQETQEVQKKQKDLQELHNAYAIKKILKAEVVSIDSFNFNSINYVAVLKYGEFRVIIPAVAFVNDIPKESVRANSRSNTMITPDEYCRRTMGHYLNAPILFVVTHIGEPDNPGEDPIIIGNHIEANSICQKIWFFNRDESKNLVEGNVVQGTIISVMEQIVIVEVGGVEQAIHRRFLLHRYVDDLRTVFKPGETLRVRIMKIEKDVENNKVRLVLSHIAVTPDPRLKNFKFISPDSTYAGIVVGLREKSIIVHLPGVDMDCSCHYTLRYRNPKKGDQIQVRVLQYNEKTLRTYGRVIAAPSAIR